MWPFTIQPKSPEAIQSHVRIFEKQAGFYGGRVLLTDEVSPPGVKLFQVDKTIRSMGIQVSSSDYGEITYPHNVAELLESGKAAGEEGAPIPYGLRLFVGRKENKYFVFGAGDELMVSGSMVAQEIMEIENEEAFCVRAVAQGIYGALAK
jgi:hypothetical protein